MANAGLYALAGVLESLGGSGGDKILEAVKTYGRNKYLAEFGKKFGVFDGGSGSGQAVPPPPGIATTAGAAQPTPIPSLPGSPLPVPQAAAQPSPLDVISGVSPDPMAGIRPVGKLSAGGTSPMEPAPKDGLKDKVELARQVIKPGSKIEQASSTMGWNKEVPILPTAAEYQAKKFQPDETLRKDMKLYQQKLAFAESSPFATEDEKQGLRNQIRIVQDAINKDEERGRKFDEEQSQQALKIMDMTIAQNREYDRIAYAEVEKMKDRINDNDQKEKDRENRRAIARIMANSKGDYEKLYAPTIDKLSRAISEENDQIREDIAELDAFKKGYVVTPGAIQTLEARGFIKPVVKPGLLGDKTEYVINPEKVKEIEERVRKMNQSKSELNAFLNDAMRKTGISGGAADSEKSKAEKPKSEVKSGSVNGVNYKVTIKRD